MLGESGANFLYRILNYESEKCKKLLRLNVHCFRYLVDIMVERGFLQDGRSINVAEQIAICLFILARGASYQEAKEQLST